MLTLDLSSTKPFTGEINITHNERAVITNALEKHNMSGWKSLPDNLRTNEMKYHAQYIRENSDTLVVCGAGGSSLGARALIDALRRQDSPKVLYTGDNLSGISMSRLADELRNCDFSVVVSSKSGTTTETLAALRVLLTLLAEKYRGSAYSRITVVTERKRTPLRIFAEENYCGLFNIPENVGGRYSIFTPANLIPAAVCGVDIDALVQGAASQNAHDETAFTFAAVRNKLYEMGYSSEIFACFEPVFTQFGMWWRQLFGESEGKNGGGAFPSVVSYTGDLHSMGQYVQDGRRDIYETVVSFAETDTRAKVPEPVFADGFDHLTGRAFAEINDLTRAAVLGAHFTGGVPVVEIRAGKYDEHCVGELLQFFMTACAASCFLRGVDPFDQPGVEAYKSRVRSALKK